MRLPRPLRGVVPPTVTPLLDRDTLDAAGLERLIGRFEAAGVSALFILGTTGEAPGLSYRLRREMIDRVCRQAADRLPVLAGVADTSLVESLRLAEYAAARGAAALVVAPPYYFPMSQGEYLSFLERVSGAYPLPLFLYNLPRNVGFAIEPETVRRAAELPNVVGLKDSSGDLEHLREVIRLLRGTPGFSILNGPEQMLAEAVAMGAHGGVCGGANLYPALYVRLYEAARDGDAEAVARLHAKVMQICDLVYAQGPEESSYLRGLKCALGLAGICAPGLAEPYVPLPAAAREAIDQALIEIGLLSAPA